MFPGAPFGQTPATTATAGFTFPQATTTPALPAPGTTFGAAQPTFGTPAQPATSQQGFSGFSFPAAAAPTSQSGGGFQMAPASTVAPNMSLFSSTLGGQNKPTAAAPAFNFATPTAQAKTTAQPTMGFGLTAPKTAAVATATTASTGFNFGTPTTSAAPAQTLNFGLGSNVATTAAGFNLTTAPATTSAGLTFGTGVIPASSAPTSFGLGTALTATSAASAAPTFGLGTALTATSAASAAPTFGLPTATATTSAPSTTAGGLGGTTSFNLGKGTSLATKPDQLKANPLTSLTAAPAQSQAPNYKDDLIPQELMVLVENFKTFVKEQKSSSSVVNRASLKQITKVTEDAELLKRMTMQLERTVNKNKVLNRKLREDVARGIQDSEVVQRLSMDPRGFPTDNSLAFEYFRNIVDRFQQQAESLTVELRNLEKHIACKLNPTPFTPEELSAIMKQLYECFVALAGRYQSLHSSITSLKLEMQRKKDPWYGLNSQRCYQTNALLN